MSDDFAEVAGIHRLVGYPDSLQSAAPVSQAPARLRSWAESDVFLNGVTWISLNHDSAEEDYEFLQGEIEKIRPALAKYLGEADHQ